MIAPVSSSTAVALRAITSRTAPVAPVAPVAREHDHEPAPSLDLTPSTSPGVNVAAQEGLPATRPDDQTAQQADEGGSSTAGGKELTEEQKAEIAKLQARDREVRTHEQAHASAGGALAGAPSYSYQTGPDGRQYAVGGEVPIRSSASSSNPRTAIQQLQQVVRAALAPASPSGQDRAVAAGAQQQIAQLQAELAQETQAKAKEALQSGGEEDKPLLPALPGQSESEGDSGTAGGAIGRSLSGPIAAYQQAGSRTGSTSNRNGGLLSVSA